MQFYDIPRSVYSFTTFPGRDAAIRHALAGTQFMTRPGRDAVLRHALDGTQFYDMPKSGRCSTTSYQHFATTCKTNPDSIPTLAQCWFNVVHYDGPWPTYNLGPV